MRYLFIILAFISLSGYSQSVHIDGPTGTAADLSVASSADSADIVLFEQSGTSKSITAHALHTYAHDMGATSLSTEGTQTIGTGGPFEKLYEGNMAYTAGYLEGFTESNGRLTYTGTVTDHIIIICDLTIHSGETAQRVQFRIAINGSTLQGSNQSTDFTATTLDASIGLNWIGELETNDYIEIFGTSDTNGDEFDIHSLTLSVFRH